MLYEARREVCALPGMRKVGLEDRHFVRSVLMARARDVRRMLNLELARREANKPKRRFDLSMLFLTLMAPLVMNEAVRAWLEGRLRARLEEGIVGKGEP